MPTIRGSSITSSSAGSYTLPFSSLTPAVPQTGDTAFLFVAGGWQANAAPSGWTTLDASPGANWNGSIYMKSLTAGDISTGSVSVSMAGSFDTVLVLIVYVGAVNIRAVTTSRNGSGSSTIALASASTIQATDHVLLFGSNRANSTDTVDKGTGVVTISGGTGGNASGVVTEYVPGTAGSFTANFAYSTAGSGNYQATVPVVDAGSTTVQDSDLGRQTLGSAAASARVSDIARQVLRSSTAAVTSVQTSDVTRQTLGSKTAAATVADIVRQTLMSSTIGSGRRRQLINPI